ncbi:MAG: triose-phosphate isomerase [Candidatus Midichloria sp.]|nr:MAG: triose-phosphate isomerase [Candidatus Midichloria sp.]
MTQRSKLVIANWKMNILLRDAFVLLKSVKTENHLKNLVVCPPFVYISTLISAFAKLNFGAQDCSANDLGAHTGEISASMLYEIGCKYVIIGHSERRINLGEDNKIIGRKLAKALEAGITPIICIGESLIKNQNSTLEYLFNQLEEIGVDSTKKFVIAYEPIWAIGSGITPIANEISYIFAKIKDIYPHLQLLYGGSVNPENADEFFSIDILDGLLVGGASLSEKKLNQILME